MRGSSSLFGLEQCQGWLITSEKHIPDDKIHLVPESPKYHLYQLPESVAMCSKSPLPCLIITSLYSEDSEEGWYPHACGHREEFAGVGYPFQHVGTKDRTQVIRLGRRCLCTLNHLIGPKFSSECWHSSLNFKFTLTYLKLANYWQLHVLPTSPLSEAWIFVADMCTAKSRVSSKHSGYITTDPDWEEHPVNTVLVIQAWGLEFISHICTRIWVSTPHTHTHTHYSDLNVKTKALDKEEYYQKTKPAKIYITQRSFSENNTV